MKPTPRAVIDVGTNSVKLLIADVTGSSVTPLHEESQQTRLGHGLYSTHSLQASAIEKTAAVVAGYARKVQDFRVKTLRVIATSAARDAKNAQTLADAVLQQSGVKLEIITGKQEAQWAFAGISSDPRLDGCPLLIMDAGGGSTQLIYGNKSREAAHHSYGVGAVRLLHKFPPSEPPLPQEMVQCLDWLRGYFQAHTPQDLASWKGDPAKTPQFVGTGGSSSLLGAMQLGLERFDREKIESVELTADQVAQRLRQLWSLSLDERRKIPGLPANKADVVLMGVAIHEAVMREFSLPSMRISTRGFRFAALLEGNESEPISASE